MKKLYKHNEITYDLLHRNVGKEVTINAFGLTGEVTVCEDGDGDIFYQYENVDGNVRYFWLFYKGDEKADWNLMYLEVDEKLEVDWNEVIEHPVIVPNEGFFEAGGLGDELLELNRMLFDIGDGNYFDYEVVDMTDYDSYLVLHFHTNLNSDTNREERDNA